MRVSLVVQRTNRRFRGVLGRATLTKLVANSDGHKLATLSELCKLGCELKLCGLLGQAVEIVRVSNVLCFSVVDCRCG